MDIVKRNRSEVKVQVGDRVDVMSTYFKDGCELDEFYGKVKFVSIPLKCARVLWDVDSSLSDVRFYDLKILDLDAPKQKPLLATSDLIDFHKHIKADCSQPLFTDDINTDKNL